MKTWYRIAALAPFALGIAGAAAPTLDNESAAQLRLLQEVPDVAGTLVYRGAVSALADGAAVFSYERRVADAGPGLLAASHVTRDAAGQVLIGESALVDSHYALHRFDAVNRQQGYSGSAEPSADGRMLHYRVRSGGRVKTASERIDAPAVSGPSLHGYILTHWDGLAAGGELSVRMVVLKEMRSYAFTIRRSSQSAGVTSFSVTPSSWFVRLALAPLSVSFDAASRHVVRYEGRVPPLRDDGGRLAALDARVDYTMAASHYR